MAPEQQFDLFRDTQEPSLSSSDILSNTEHSHYVIYVDESGDHSLTKIDPNFPVFTLAFCIFHKRHYVNKVIPLVNSFKFRHFGHDLIVLHEADIKKEREPFNIFRSDAEQQRFMSELHEIIKACNFVVISCTIHKQNYKTRGELQQNDNPYYLALSVCLEKLYTFLKEKGQEQKKTHILVECRGKKEDRELELEFRRLCSPENNRFGKNLPFQIILADKKTNSSGLQLTDLVARPISRKVIEPQQANRAFDVLEHKFYCKSGRSRTGEEYEGYGMNILPPQKAKGPDETHRGHDADQEPPIHLVANYAQPPAVSPVFPTFLHEHIHMHPCRPHPRRFAQSCPP